MWVKAYRVDIGYEIDFAQPVFELPTKAVQVLEAFYKCLSPRFPMGMSDLQSLGGVSYADIMLRINLSGANGAIAITAERLSASFTGLRSNDELKTVENCVTLSEDALNMALPELSVRARNIRVLSWLECEGGSDAVKRLLDKHGQAELPLAGVDLGADELNYRFGAELTNAGERWSAVISLEGSAIKQANLYFRLETNFLEDGKYDSLERRIEHTRDLYYRILKGFGLEPTANS